MNIAVVFAGGTGKRMNTRSKPKQFLEMHGKPVLVYTLEIFQNHPMIDKIILVCFEPWIEYAKSLLKKYFIDKVCYVILGGDSGQESIFNGIKVAHEEFPDESTVLIHDGVRPLIDEDTITACIQTVEQYGNAITVAPAIETIFLKDPGTNQVGTIFNRAYCEMAKAPQCFKLSDIYQTHCKAIREGQDDFIDSAQLMQYYGFSLYTVEGPSENIKITTPSDFYIFRAIMDAKESLQILGL
ncbi:IspD/TarI family cytidylyltransferase [uncultured Megasphaera sp.]|uniref:IspD/TarI family cytidylyltransferase n=1 Tax=uncultured Megasphaera sp. TaxID=165188 RepID=UPI0026331F93|nr:IspD/TarI family cytidylyltransferase [uncultured Megasphaera sp.]